MIGDSFWIPWVLLAAMKELRSKVRLLSVEKNLFIFLNIDKDHTYLSFIAMKNLILFSLLPNHIE